MSTISTTVTTTVTVGSTAYGSPLTITDTGAVAPADYGALGVYENGVSFSLTNDGHVNGGLGARGAGSTTYYGAAGGTGGAALQLVAGNVGNSGYITGGTGGAGGGGGYNVGGVGGTGGTGVMLSGGTLTNQSHIAGGSGGYGGETSAGYSTGGAGGVGGTGVMLSGGTLTNNVSISGGQGGNGAYGGYSGPGGIGGAGGVGINVSAGTLINNSDISGGTGGAGAAASFPPLFNTIDEIGGAGGTGVVLTGATLTNGGSITGGSGFGGPWGPGGAGGVGVVMNGATLTNDGGIAGGKGAPSGHGLFPSLGGDGGIGVYATGGTLTNNSTITGGDAGGGAKGGTGVRIDGATLTNSGSITGGSGGTGTVAYQYPGGGYPGGAGGLGVFIDGGTLITSGTITGGQGGTGIQYGNGAAGDAVKFGALAGNLTVDPGAVFNGNVVATIAVNDVLELTGSQSGGTSITLGTQFTNFQTLQFGAGAAWTVNVGTGAASQTRGLTVEGFSAGDKIDVTNLTPTQVAADFNPTTDRLTTTVDGTLHFTGMSDESLVFTSDGGTGTYVTIITGSEISTTITKTVTLGSTAYPSPLTITNTGVVAPTAVGASGVISAVAGNALTNYGSILGGRIAGEGVNLAAGTLTNYGSIAGGIGGNGASFGGIGVAVGDGTLTNRGSISGGNGGGEHGGGAGVNANGGTLTNYGSITGGTGSGGSIPLGFNGGAGVYLRAGDLTNNGTIVGGAGGAGTDGGRGGFGVLVKGGTLTNYGTIKGGIGGSGSMTGGNGGPGVFLNGGTLITAGSIWGRVGGAGPNQGSFGDSVQFGTVASTLLVDPGAVFVGQVVANATAADVLELLGTQHGGTAIILGSQFTNFSTLEFAFGAAWQANATVADLVNHPLTIQGFGLDDTLNITNLVEKGATWSFNTSTDQLTINQGTTAITLAFNSDFAGDHFVLSGSAQKGTEVRLATGAGATVAALGRDAMNFVGGYRANAATQDARAYGVASHALMDHGVALSAIGAVPLL